MTTATELVTSAFREGNLIAVGSSPTADELTEALARLNSFWRGLLGTVIGEHLADWQVPSNLRTAPNAGQLHHTPYPHSDPGGHVSGALPDGAAAYPPPNSRILCGITTATTIYFPARPHDGARIGIADVGMSATATLEGNGRLIGSTTSTTFAAGATATQWFYRGDLGSWQPVATLVAATESPLPVEHDDLLVCGLCIRLSSRQGLDPRPSTIAAYQAQERLVRTRYSQPTPAIGGGGAVPSTMQSYDSMDWMT